MKVLLVTSTVDLGSSSLAQAVHGALSSTSQCIRVEFTKELAIPWFPQNPYLKRSLRAMWIVPTVFRIRRAQRRGTRVVFVGVTALTACGPFIDLSKTVCITDWTRTLFATARLRHKEHLGIVNNIQCALFSRVGKFVALTYALKENLVDVYGLNSSRISVMLPPSTRSIDDPRCAGQVGSPLELLFVGGDIDRKGGVELIQWAEKSRSQFHLVMLTRDRVVFQDDRIEVKLGVKVGDEAHHQAFLSSDLLILPTHQDAFPMTIVEAAEFGLPIFTTMAALGAPMLIQPGKNGEVFQSSSEMFVFLEELLQQPQRVLEYKLAAADFAKAFLISNSAKALSDLIFNFEIHDSSNPAVGRD